jgi:geranylgeranyl diphosphate synthase type I
VSIATATTYDAYRHAVDAELRSTFAEREGMLYDILRYHLGWVDERGNPTDATPTPIHLCGILTLGAAQAVAGDCRPAVPAAASVELVYNFVLVHNDVQAGRVDQTSNRPSIWWVWGPSQAINAGDGLHALARSVLMRLSDAGVAAETVLAALSALDRACLTLCEGQYMDLTYQDQLMVSEADYMDMIDRKSGALAGCSARLGALSCGAQPATADALEQWGTKLGMARQVRDDIYDLWGRSGDGFTPANILNKKKSLPLIHALHHTDTAAKRELGGIYMKRVLEPGDAPRIVSILDEAGSREYSNEKIDQLLRQAREAVTGANVTLEQPELLDWATKLIVDRDS